MLGFPSGKHLSRLFGVCVIAIYLGGPRFWGLDGDALAASMPTLWIRWINTELYFSAAETGLFYIFIEQIVRRPIAADILEVSCTDRPWWLLV